MITVMIATYNRSADLKVVLGSLQDQELPRHLDYEVLIIDNNSNDATKTVVESFMPAFGGKLKYAFEPRQGKPYAINRGLKQAKGEIIVFTDDDCVLEKDYLAKIQKTFEDCGPSISFIGGKITPRWVNCTKPEWFDHLKPEWFKECFWGPLAILDYGNTPFIIDHRQVNSNEKKLFYGANMAVRRELFLKHGDFNLKMRVSEDTEFQLRFLKAGAQGFYAPHIKVSHKVTPGRLEPRYYYRWYFLRGLYSNIYEYPRKFYHPLGIQGDFIFKTFNLAVRSLKVPSHLEKMHKRFEILFNLGQMIQIAKKNII